MLVRHALARPSHARRDDRTEVMTRVCFLIRSLEAGGAERQLVDLVRALDSTRFQITILTFYPGGALEDELAGSKVELVSLNKRGRWEVGGFLRRAYAAMVSRRPDIVHGYLGVANEIAWLLGRACGAHVVWGVRSSSLDLTQYDWTFRASFAAGMLLSRFVDLIIYNSHAGALVHWRYGYKPRREVVISNGVDVARFRRDESGRVRLRAHWGIAPEEWLVGIVGRIDPIKGYEVFLAAASILHDDEGRWRFVCVGGGDSAYARGIRDSSAARRLGRALVWAGARSDMSAVYSAMDCIVLSSSGEGLPNALAEAMSCEVGCVTTDVGDAARLVGDTGFVVPVGDARRIADACRMLRAENAEDRSRRVRAARARVAAEYSLAKLAFRTAEELEALAMTRTSAPPATRRQ